MSDMMMLGIAMMPYELAMGDELSRRQFYANTQRLVAALEATRAEVERLQEAVRPRREDECLTLDHWRIRAYHLEENWSRCSRACAIEQDKREQAEARAKQLAEELRKLEEREQRDEALLRQALEALSRAHQTAMEQTLKARLPECAEFAGIAQDLEFVINNLRNQFAEAQKAVSWARPVYATEPVDGWEAGDLVDIEFYNRPEKPEGEGWRPLVFADTGGAALDSAAQPGARRWPPVYGIGRDASHSRAVVVYLAAEPTDDEMRALHDAVRGEAAPSDLN